jgi:Fic family protein
MRGTPVLNFLGRSLPEPAVPVGYAALIQRYHLRLPLPPRLSAIAQRFRPESSEQWQLFNPRRAPDDSLGGHLEFSLKREGVDLLVLSRLFEATSTHEVEALIRSTPTGAYARRIWFLYEWLTGRELNLPDSDKVKAVPVVDPTQQYASEEGEISTRHRVVNNLPGHRNFCPMVRRTPVLEGFRARNLAERARAVLGRTHPDVIHRAAAFFMLSDSQASFRIEGERPSASRAVRWGHAIAEAGSRLLSIAELERLQRLVIGDARFVRLGLRNEGGFIGPRNRITGEPIPEHISARAEDLPDLMEGLIAYDARATRGAVDPIIAAAAAAFGFVYIHPFEDGNGRLHRWLVHHLLAAAGFNPPGLVFPISAVILREIEAYKRVLTSYSRPLLGCCIEWRPTDTGNVEVLNDTGDYYRYFDATAHAEFLYRCVAETVEKDLPNEVAYLEAFDRFAEDVSRMVDMPEKTLHLLHDFLRRGEGRFSKRAREKEFAALTDAEAERIEQLYRNTLGKVEAPAAPSG